MTEHQEKIKKFWQIDSRPGAIFEGKLLDVAQVEKDPKLAERYWNSQLRACHANWMVSNNRSKGPM